MNAPPPPPPAPRDTHNRSQRASRPVPFDSRGDLWAAVQEGVVYSADLNDRFEFSPVFYPTVSRSPITPAAGSVRAAMPFQRQQQQLPPMSAPPLGGGGGGGGGPRPPPVVVRAPLGEVTLNVFGTEIKELENENAALKKHVELQDKVIVGFCALQVYERENRRPA